MFRFLHYYGRYQGFRGNLGRFPAWGRLILLLAALPGIAAIGLSILAFAVSLLALLLLTAPAYWLIRAICGGGSGPDSGEFVDVTVSAEPPTPSPGRRQVDVKIIE